MKTNYDSLKERSEVLANFCIQADEMVKTFPEKAASLYGRALNSFLSVICSDNDIAFDGAKDLTLINMIGTIYSAGVISKYEKGVLDDIRYASFMAENPSISYSSEDTKSITEKIISFYGMVMRYFHLEEESYNENILPIGNCDIIEILKNFEMDSAYDKIYLASEKEGSYAVIAQYIKGRSDFSDSVFSLLEQGLVTTQFGTNKILKPIIVPHQENNNLICVKTVIPEGYVKLSFDDLSELCTEHRLKFIVNLAGVISALHEESFSLGGFNPYDIWISYKTLKCVISGMESKIGCALSSQENILADVKSFSALCGAIFPEYDKIPVAGLLIKHALMGSEKVSMDKIYSSLKKEGRRHKFQSKILKEEIFENPSVIYENLNAEGIVPQTNTTDEETPQDLNFSEMYNKIFN